MIKLIVSDLDGTLLRPGKQELEPHVLELIERILQQGYHFAAASGRQYTNIRRMFGKIASKLTYICENGSLVVCQNELLYRGEIETSLRNQLITEILQSQTSEILLSGVKNSYISPRSEYYYNLIVNRMKNDTELMHDLRKVEEIALKVSIYEQNKVLQEQELKWIKQYEDRLHVVRSSDKWLDFMPLSVSKGNALRMVMERMAIRPSECMVFGDQANDIDMMYIADHTYGMKSGAPELKKCVKYIVGHPMEVLYQLDNFLTPTRS